MGKAWASLEEKVRLLEKEAKLREEINALQQQRIEELTAENEALRSARGKTPQAPTFPEEVPVDNLDAILKNTLNIKDR